MANPSAGTREDDGDVLQKRTDHLVYYRNLAIMLGAKPSMMLNKFDRMLAQTYPWDFGSREKSQQDVVAEVEDAWEMAERLATAPDAGREAAKLEFIGFTNPESVFERVRGVMADWTNDYADDAAVADIIEVLVDALLADRTALRASRDAQESQRHD